LNSFVSEASKTIIEFPASLNSYDRLIVHEVHVLTRNLKKKLMVVVAMIVW